MTDYELLVKEYPYFYETHLHTNASSKCGKDTPEDMVVACKEFGYTGIIVTDHNWGGNTSIDLDLPWEEFVREYWLAYERAKKKGDEIGLSVFFGYEAGFAGTEFLIYGISKEWMINTPALRTAGIKEQYELIHEGGGIVVHAHPFREEPYIKEIRLFPEYIDAVEGANATHEGKRKNHERRPDFDEKARAYAKKHSLPMTGGSDVHSIDMIGGGIRTRRKLNNIHDFTRLIMSGKDYVIFDSDNAFPPM